VPPNSSARTSRSACIKPDGATRTSDLFLGGIDSPPQLLSAGGRAGEVLEPHAPIIGVREAMEPHIDVITLAVGDLDRSLAFYRDGLGLETTGVVAAEFVDEETDASGAIVIFRLNGGLVLALYPRSELARDADIPFGPPKTGEFSIGQLVESSAEVDALLAQAEQAGAIVTGRPHDRPWGIYSGYFRDPDGHLWEIIWNAPTKNTAQ
jgi:uncharacterized protein